MNYVETFERSATDRVRTALRTLKGVNSDYYWKMLKMRSEPEGGIGSVYPATSEEIESDLFKKSWFLYEHPEISEGCIGARCNLPGRLGLIAIEALPGVEYTLVDPKGTGKCELLAVGALPRWEVTFTVAILGKSEGNEVVFTFHPGDPIKPSSREGLKHGDVVTSEQALALGFKYAKVA